MEITLDKLDQQDVLDHGFVRVVDYMGSDSSIVHAARVSYGQGTTLKRDELGLIRYLMRHRHTSPFEMCEIVLHLRMPIFVARQWIRHRTANVNEYSMRYSEPMDLVYSPEDDRIQEQSTSNKQGSGEGVDIRGRMSFQNACASVQSVVKSALEVGKRFKVARELNRINVTVAHYTEFYWKIDAHNLMHFLKLRTDPHAQYEIRVFAEAIENILAIWLPVTYEAWLEYIKHGRTFSASELQVLSALTDKTNLGDVLAASPLSESEKKEFLFKLEQS